MMAQPVHRLERRCTIVSLGSLHDGAPDFRDTREPEGLPRAHQLEPQVLYRTESIIIDLVRREVVGDAVLAFATAREILGDEIRDQTIKGEDDGLGIGTR